jgi:UDP-N-acetylmuramoylalanine--D-glutamate ligase
MDVAYFKGKKITIMGLGLHGGGVGIVRFLHSCGSIITLTDMKTKEELSSSLEKLNDLKNIKYVFNQHRPEDFAKADMVLKNPSVPWTNKYIKIALENKIPVEIDSSLFFKLCKNDIIGITGTKGKTTTATLIFEILKKAGKNPIKVGIGQISVLDKLKELKKDSVVVFELSSWRLSAMGRNGQSPHVAVITNIYPDHLNYYKNMEEYVADKVCICQSQKPNDFCIINWDNEILKSFEVKTKSQIIKFSRNKIEKGKNVYLSDGSIFINDGNDEKKVIGINEAKICGIHNIENIMAAIAASYASNIDMKIVRSVISEFKGVAHRLEFVREFKGARYYNDTAATTPEAAIAVISSFSEPVVLICGGSDKNLDMGNLAKIIIAKIKSAFFLKGAATEKLELAIKKIDPEYNFQIKDSMEEAIAEAGSKAQPGDVVLLSPGAASFGMFLNEFDRGDKFKAIVNALK